MILETKGQMMRVGITGLGSGGGIHGEKLGEEEKRRGNGGESLGERSLESLGGQKRPVLRDGMRA